MTFHRLYTDILPPDTFTDPFCYEPHPLCLMAVNDLIGRIEKPENTSNTAFLNEARQGKMFGVLVAQKPRPSASGAMPIGYSGLFRTNMRQEQLAGVCSGGVRLSANRRLLQAP